MANLLTDLIILAVVCAVLWLYVKMLAVAWRITKGAIKGAIDGFSNDK